MWRRPPHPRARSTALSFAQPEADLVLLWRQGHERPGRGLSRRLQKPRRSRANLRPRSRSASVIDRLPKNQNPLENRNNLRSSSPHPGPGQTSGEPRRNFAVRNSSTRTPWLFRSPVFGSGIRRLDGEAVGGRRLARTQPRRVARWLATPPRYFRVQNRGAVNLAAGRFAGADLCDDHPQEPGLGIPGRGDPA